MAETVAQNAQTTFADPQNGQSPIDADQVTANDNALRAKHNTHDADSTIHVQGSALASRPSAGTDGRKWMTRDAGVVRLFRDSGSAWEELSYVPTSSNATITGVLTFSAAPIFSTAQAFAASVSVTGSVSATTSLSAGTTLSVTGASTLAAVSATNITASGTLGVTGAATFTTVSVSSTLAVTGNVTFSGTLGVTGAVTAASFVGSGASLTSLPAAELTGTINQARLPGTITTLTVTNLTATNPISGTVTNATTATQVVSSSNNLKVDAAEATFLTASGSFITTSAPGGGGTTRYINVTVDGVACRIACVTVA